MGNVISIARGGSISIGGSVHARETANQARTSEAAPSIATNLLFDSNGNGQYDGLKFFLPIWW